MIHGGLLWFIDKNGSMEKNVDSLLAKIASNITNNKNKKWKKTRSLKVKPYSYKSERLEFHAKNHKVAQPIEW